MDTESALPSRFGLSVPTEWWPTRPSMKEIGAAGFGWVQLPAPPESVLVDPRSCIRHARGAGDAVAGAGLRCVLHAPAELIAGRPETDRAVEGAIAYAAECGAAAVVLHARAYGDGPGAGDRALAETRSLARIALIAERLGVTLALENLAPVYPGPETISASPLSLRALARRIASPAVGLCLDVGHANVVAGLRRTSLSRMVEPVLDMVALLHVHDNLGARWIRDERPELDPVRLDLHLPPGRGSIPWETVAPSLLGTGAPLVWEIHPPRPAPAEIMDAARNAMEATPQTTRLPADTAA
ncbi:MAG: sugar phosphate isomerase/epimerase [Solirubrobacterales bacterium]|nr:sugar phosphate isomerase/epimerase [Solirubrobacterales bacterium]